MPDLRGAIGRDVDSGLYDGAVTIVAVGGKVVFDEATGFADRLGGRVMRRDSVFPIFSIAKAISAVAVLQQVERGRVRLNTPVCEIIPEFARRGKQRVTIGHLLCHSGGMPASFPAVPPEKAGDLDAVVAAVCDVGLEAVPGEEVSYSPIMAYAVLGQCVRVLDGGGRRFRDIVGEDVLAPLGMRETSLGLTRALVERAVAPRISDTSPGLFDPSGLMWLASSIPRRTWKYRPAVSCPRQAISIVSPRPCGRAELWRATGCCRRPRCPSRLATTLARCPTICGPTPAS